MAEARSGRLSAAVARLRPVCAASDDPAYAGTLGLLVRDAAGDADDPEAEALLNRARDRFAQLLALHPEAFAGHAAQFRQAEGRQPNTSSMAHRDPSPEASVRGVATG